MDWMSFIIGNISGAFVIALVWTIATFLDIKNGTISFLNGMKIGFDYGFNIRTSIDKLKEIKNNEQKDRCN